MTVATAPSFQDYSADGAGTDFSIPFSFQSQATWIHVYDISLGQQQKVEYTQGVDYTVQTGSNQRVVFAVAPADGTAIQLRRIVPLTQTVQYPTTGGFPNASHERAVDKITMLIQQVYDAMLLGDFGYSSIMALGADGCFDAQGYRICNLAAGTDGNDACTVAQATAIATGGVVTNFGGFGVDTFTADGGTDYTLSVMGVDAQDLIVSIQSAIQVSDALLGSYTVDNSGNPLSGTVLTFGTAPTAGDIIQVRWPKGTVVSDLEDVTLTTDNYAAGSVTPDKLYTSLSYLGYFMQTINSGGNALPAWLPLNVGSVSGLAAYLNALSVSFFEVPVTDLPMNAHKITGLADGVSAQDAATVAQLSLRKRAQSGTFALAGGSKTVTFPWNVAQFSFWVDGPTTEDNVGVATFGANGTITGAAYPSTRAWTATRATSGSNKTVAFTLTGGGTSTLHYCGLEGDA